MRVSQLYGLPRKQGLLSFVDVHVERDNRLYVDPFAIRTLGSDWGARCVAQVQTFFSEVLRAIKEKRHQYAIALLERLREPNETRLGLSRGRPRGHALGPGLAEDIWKSLATSRAVRSGVLQDLEETALLVEGIGYDIVSDMTTVLIRPQLIVFTRDICQQYEIPTQEVRSGSLWNASNLSWQSPQAVALPVAKGRRLLLVPKVIVRPIPIFNVREYFSFIVDELQEREYRDPRHDLLHLLKNGRPRIYKNELIATLLPETPKEAVTKATATDPSLLAAFRTSRNGSPPPPVEDEEITSATGGSAEARCDEYLDWLCNLTPGQSDANDFRDATLSLFDCLFSPALAGGRAEVTVNERRGRVDVRFVNFAPPRTFFGWVAGVAHINCGNIVVECKNYAEDPKNPEFAQVLDRLSHYDKVGILICPKFTDRAAARARARDIRGANDRFVFPLDCDDARRLLSVRSSRGTEAMHIELIDLFNSTFN